ncbi:uncharacterized mitochondrial protein-like protein [Tanacetum coccineum]
MITYLKNMEGWKHKDLKSKDFDSIKELFDKAFKRVNMFVDFRTNLVEGSSKRVGEELEQESTKKQKVDEDKDTTELQSLIEVILDEEEVATDVIPLATKPPTIVDWKIHKKGKKSYYQIVRADGKPVEDLDLVLWSDLKTMFEPHVEDEIWKLQQSITAALINVNAAQSKLVLLENFNENYSKCLRLLYKVNAAEGVNAASEEVSTAELVSTAYVICASTNEVNDVGGKTSIELPDDPNMPALEDYSIFDFTRNDEDDGVVADMNNLDTTIQVSPIPTTRIHKDHPLNQVMDFPDRVYKVEKALYGLHQAPRAWYETLSTYLLDNEFQRGKIDKTLFIKRYKGDILLVQVYVDDIIFGSTKKEDQKRMAYYLVKINMLVNSKEIWVLSSQDCKLYNGNQKLSSRLKMVKKCCYMYRSMIGSLMALKSQPKSGLWYPKDSPLDLVAYTNSDYARASLDRKSTTGGCQFLRSRLISWQCKETTVLEVQLQALVDGKKVNHTESTVRRDLQLEDAEGVDFLPNSTIFDQHDKRVLRLLHGMSLVALWHLQLSVLYNQVLDLEKTKTTQAEEIVSLKRRVKKLKQKKRSRTHGLKRFNDQDDADMFDVNTLTGDEVLAEQEVAIKDANLTVDEVTLAQALAALKSVKPKLKTLFKEENTLQLKEQKSYRKQTIQLKLMKKDMSPLMNMEAEVDDDQEATKIKELMKIILDEEEVSIDAIPLATKPPTIVDWKDSYKKDRKTITISSELKNIKDQCEPMLKTESRGNSTGLQKVIITLTLVTITDMLAKKLLADHFSEMAYLLLKLLTKQLN